MRVGVRERAGAMARLLERQLVGIACLAAAGLVGISAIVDHHWKQRRADSAEMSEWYCEHQGTRCGGASSNAIEARWNECELGYEIAVAALGLTGAAVIGARFVRIRH